MREPSVVAIERIPTEWSGRRRSQEDVNTPGMSCDTALKDGVISDYQITERMLRFINKVTKGHFSRVFKPRRWYAFQRGNGSGERAVERRWTCRRRENLFN